MGDGGVFDARGSSAGELGMYEYLSAAETSNSILGILGGTDVPPRSLERALRRTKKPWHTVPAGFLRRGGDEQSRGTTRDSSDVEGGRHGRAAAPPP